MSVQTFFSRIIGCLAILLAALQVAAQTPLNTQEQQFFNALNQLRANPSAYIPVLQARLPHYSGNTYTAPDGAGTLETEEGARAVQDAIRQLRTAAPTNPVVISQGLRYAADDYATNPTIGTDADNDDYMARLNRHGRVVAQLTEETYFGFGDVDEVLVDMLIDDGDPARGTRNWLLLPDLFCIGLAYRPHPSFGSVFVIDLAIGFADGDQANEKPITEIKFTDAQPAAPPQPDRLPATEQAVVDELNLLRANPPAYADILQQMLPYFDGKLFKKPGEINLMTNEGAAAVKEAIQVLRSTKPLPAFAGSECLAKAARDHANDTGPSGITGHDGSDGSSMADRIERYCNWGTTIGENIDYGSSAARDIVISLVVDDGVRSRGHRNNILSTSYSFVGIALGPHKEYRSMCVMDFAGSAGPK